MSSHKIHFLGSSFASSAACGRAILTHREAEHGGPAHTADRDLVTCEKCRATLALVSVRY
ncbi:MAG TPA: hypothetical protein VGL98_03595 [Gammaproteobacteria bacterium]